METFQDKIGGRMHHIGVAVSDIKKSIIGFSELGWVWDGKIIDDSFRGVKLAFLKRYDSDEVIELVNPMNEMSPVSNTLNTMKNVATPYHICYEVSNIEKIIEILKGRKYILIDKPMPAVAFNGRRVAFMFKRDAGLIEFLEEEKNI